MDDHELLREFAQSHCEDAFRQLVERHLIMVYSAARRTIRDDHLAQDVTQKVFTMLAQKSREIKPPQVLGGWLYNTTRNLAMHTVRGEQRRREREQAAVAMQTFETNSNDADQVIDQLEPAMAQLDADDRDTLVLRYLEDRNLRDVGAEFGISADAARMKANRALDRLRIVLGRQGVAVTSVFLGTTLVSGVSSTVPVGLASTITTTALTSAILTTATITTMNWINAKAVTAIVGAAIITGTGTYLIKQRQIDRLRGDNQNLMAQQAALTANNEEALKAAQVDKNELERLRKDAGEVLRLRNEVAQARRQSDADKQRIAKQAASAKPVRPVREAGVTIGRAQLANVGYATPENALQTITWATMSGGGTSDNIAESLSPELLADPAALQIFEKNRKQSESVFKSVEMLAKKTVGENMVEFKVALEVDLGPNAPQRPPPVMVLPMIRVGNQWKLASNPHQYKAGWDKEGQVETYAP